MIQINSKKKLNQINKTTFQNETETVQRPRMKQFRYNCLNR